MNIDLGWHPKHRFETVIREMSGSIIILRWIAYLTWRSIGFLVLWLVARVPGLRQQKKMSFWISWQLSFENSKIMGLQSSSIAAKWLLCDDIRQNFFCPRGSRLACSNSCGFLLIYSAQNSTVLIVVTKISSFWLLGKVRNTSPPECPYSWQWHWYRCVNPVSRVIHQRGPSDIC